MVSKNNVGLVFAALLAAGVDDCSHKEVPERSVETAHIIGYASHDPLCGDGPRWEVELETRSGNAFVCVPSRDGEILNFSTQDGESYTMILSPRYAPNGKILSTLDHLNNIAPVVNLEAIAASQLPEYIHAAGKINLSYPDGGNLCPDGQRLYGFRVPPVSAQAGGHRRILFCDEREIPFDREIMLTAQATAIRDQVGRPVYKALDLKILEEL